MGKTTRKTNIRSIIIAGIISIFVGIFLMFLGSHSLNHSFQRYLLNAGYSLFIGLGLFANGFIFNLIEPRFISWIEKPVSSIIVAIVTHLVYSSILIYVVSWIYFGKLLNTPDGQFWHYYKYTMISVLIVTIFITSIMYLKSFFNAYREEAIESERLKREAITLQYQVMQNQVNPHFLFNTLNTLGSLIDIDKEKAKEYTKNLSLFLRELLQFKDLEVISLQDELSFVKKYIYLQKIRFGSNFNVDILISKHETGLVIPMSIQMLVENAVKHNVIAREKPLSIIVAKKENELIVENNRQPKNNVEGSNRIGLDNLKNRYYFLTNQKVNIESNESYYRVSIPLIKLQ